MQRFGSSDLAAFTAVRDLVPGPSPDRPVRLKVSIVTPSFNQNEYLERTICSFANEKWNPRWEADTGINLLRISPRDGYLSRAIEGGGEYHGGSELAIQHPRPEDRRTL